MKQRPDAIDVHVGHRVRDRRTALRLTQEFLANEVGLSFQQIQKYENGKNRISAGRLQQFARTLNVNVPWFFYGTPSSSRGDGKSESLSWLKEFTSSPEGQKLMKAFVRIKDKELRRHIAQLVERLAEKR